MLARAAGSRPPKVKSPNTCVRDHLPAPVKLMGHEPPNSAMHVLDRPGITGLAEARSGRAGGLRAWNEPSWLR